MKVSKIGIVSRFDRQDALDMVKKIHDEFNSKVDIYLSPGTGERLKISSNLLPVYKMRDAGVQLIISVGGDGTALRNISKMKDPLPVLGINLGNLGFLVDVPPEDAIEDIEDVLKGFTYTERSRLSVSLGNKNLPDATNEIVLITARPAKILTFRISIDGTEIEDIRADGVVFATPTGSTAYAMSAGGPIVDPRVDASIIVPLAPFKLSARPLIIPGSSTINVEMIIPEKEAAVVIDGQHTYSMKENDIVTITKAQNPARFVSSSINGFYEKVQSKLA